MTTTETIRRLRSALAPFAGEWDESHTYLPDIVSDQYRLNSVLMYMEPEHWKEASRVMRDTAHAERAPMGSTAWEQIAALNAMYESMLTRKAELDRMIAESRALIDTYKEAEP